MQPRVVDLSHHNVVVDLKATAAAGVRGIIHKASQGSSIVDSTYPVRRKQARAASLLWGAYHFNDGSDVRAQVDNFLSAADPDDATLLVLDFEDNPKSNMSIQQAIQFLRLLEERTGRKGAIYSGNRLKETIGKLGPADRAYLCAHRLWLCQYGPHAMLPSGFHGYFLWQYTGDGNGPQPHAIAGIKGSGIDLNVFDGADADLVAQWAPAAGHGVAVAHDDGVSTHTAQAMMDAADGAAQEGAGAVSEAAPAAQVVKPSSVQIEVIKRRLAAMGYHEFGLLDGSWGGKTAAAIAAFKNDRHLGGEPVIDQVLVDGLDQAEAEGFQRPIADVRANAKATDIADRVPAVRQTLRAKALGFWGMISTAVVGAFNGVVNNISAAREKLEPVQDFIAGQPWWVWCLALGGVAYGLYYVAEQATQANVRDFNEGKRV